MTKNSTWVGLDTHKKAVNVAALYPEQAKPQEWIVETSRRRSGGGQEAGARRRRRRGALLL